AAGVAPPSRKNGSGTPLALPTGAPPARPDGRTVLWVGNDAFSVVSDPQGDTGGGHPWCLLVWGLGCGGVLWGRPVGSVPGGVGPALPGRAAQRRSSCSHSFDHIDVRRPGGACHPLHT